jgi:hypothetical protein
VTATNIEKNSCGLSPIDSLAGGCGRVGDQHGHAACDYTRHGGAVFGCSSGGRAAPAPAATGNAVFPSALSPKDSGESAGEARMHTCLDQYHANKASGANGGLKWIEKGGGYYSECNKRLKGTA